MENTDLIIYAKKIVEYSNYSFLSKEDIKNNFKDLGFLVNENTMIGYTSYMEYDSLKQKGILSFNKDESLKRQQEILLINFGLFIFKHDSDIKMYYKDIPRKNALKRFSRYLINASVDKEFTIDVSKESKIHEGRLCK